MSERGPTRKGPKKGSFSVGRRAGPVEAPLPSDRMIWYTAGFFDGEGTIHCSDGADGRVRKVAVSSCQTETNDGERVMRLLRDTWQIGVVNLVASNSRRPNWTPTWRWNIGAYEEVLYFLRTVVPALQVKREQAVRAIALMESWPATQPAKVMLICAGCGISFERKRTRSGRPSQSEFCSPTCNARFYGPSRRKRVSVTCAHCGIVFDRRPCEVKSERVFCSKAHADLYSLRIGGYTDRRKKREVHRITYQCAICGAPVLRYPCQVKPSGRVFCCREHFFRGLDKSPGK